MHPMCVTVEAVCVESTPLALGCMIICWLTQPVIAMHVRIYQLMTPIDCEQIHIRINQQLKQFHTPLTKAFVAEMSCN